MAQQILKTGKQDNIKVLIIDDNQIFLTIASQFLKRHVEISSVVTSDGVKPALEILSQNHFEIILLDLDMPEIDGIAGLPLLLDSAPGTPIIILSMLDSRPYQEAFIKSGARAFVSKSTMGQDLMPAIHRVLD